MTHEEASGNVIINLSKKTEVNRPDKCREGVEKEEGWVSVNCKPKNNKTKKKKTARKPPAHLDAHV